MSHRRAKAIRKVLRKKQLAISAVRYEKDSKGTITSNEERRDYKQLKKAAKGNNR